MIAALCTSQRTCMRVRYASLFVHLCAHEAELLPARGCADAGVHYVTHVYVRCAQYVLLRCARMYSVMTSWPACAFANT